MGCAPSTMQGNTTATPSCCAHPTTQPIGAVDRSNCITDSQTTIDDSVDDQHHTPAEQPPQSLPQPQQELPQQHNDSTHRQPMARNHRTSCSSKMQGCHFKSTCESPHTRQREHSNHISDLVMSENAFYQQAKSGSVSVLSVGFDAFPPASPFSTVAKTVVEFGSGSGIPNRNSVTPQLASLSRTRPFVET